MLGSCPPGRGSVDVPRVAPQPGPPRARPSPGGGQGPRVPPAELLLLVSWGRVLSGGFSYSFPLNPVTQWDSKTVLDTPKYI